MHLPDTGLPPFEIQKVIKEEMKNHIYFNIGLFLTIVVVLLGALLMFVNPNVANEKLGDWGDFLGGIIAAIALVWLMVGQLENSAKSKALEQKIIEISSALATIAGVSQAQIATLFKQHEPRFEFERFGTEVTGSRNHIAQVYPSQFYYLFKNHGGTANEIEIQNLSEKQGVNISIEDTVCNAMASIPVVISGKTPIKELRNIKFQILFKDDLLRSGWTEVHIPSFESTAEVKTEIGCPPENSIPVN